MRESTKIIDKCGREIFVGDTLKCDYNYKVVVIKTDKGYSGKLVCGDNHSCKNALYCIDGETHKIIDKGIEEFGGIKYENPNWICK